MKNKVLFISHEASISGAPISLLNFIKWVNANRDNIECTVLLKKNGPLAYKFAEVCQVIEYDKIPGWCKKLPFRIQTFVKRIVQKKIIKSLTNNGYNVIYSNTVTNGDIIKKIFSYKELPVIVHVREMMLTIREFGEENFLDNLRFSKRLVANSNLTAKQLKLLCKEYGFEKDIDVVIPFVSDSLLEKQEVVVEKNEYIIGGAGSFDWRKGIELFIFVASEVIKQRSDIKFHWVGGDKNSQYYLRYLYLIEQLNIKDNFQFLDYTENPGQYYNTFDLFFLSSIEEPFSLVCLENALLKKPIICFENCSGMQEMLIPQAGIAFPLGDNKAVADGIIHLLGNKSKMTQMGENGKALVKEYATINIAAPQLLEILDKYSK